MTFESAEHYAKKQWNEEKQKFDYIYPSDLEKESKRLALKTMKSSVENDIPKALRLQGPVEKTLSTKQKQEIKHGAKVEHEHHNTIKKISDEKLSPREAEQLIAKDHIKEDPNYYPKLKKMETQQDPLFVSNLSDNAKKTFEKATTDCAPIKSIEFGMKNSLDKGNRTINLAGRLPETADLEVAETKPTSDPSRTWKWEEHSYAARTGTKGHYKYKYDNAKQNDETLEAERKMQQDKQKQFVPGQKQEEQKPAQREVNPTLPQERSNQEKANIAKAPAQKLPPQGKAGNIFNPSSEQNVQKPMRIGGLINNNGANPSGQNIGKVQPSETPTQNPLGQFISNISAPGNTMAKQAKNIRNVYDSRTIGNEDFDKQDDPEKNPLHPSKLAADVDMANRYGDCHRMAKAQADRYGGTMYTTAGRSANFHSVTVNPDNTVFDYVLGINGMPLDQYLSLVPYSFRPNQ